MAKVILHVDFVEIAVLVKDIFVESQSINIIQTISFN